MYFAYLISKLKWNTDVLVEPTFVYVIKNLQSFMKHKCSLPYSWKFTSACYPDWAESSLQHFNLFL